MGSKKSNTNESFEDIQVPKSLDSFIQELPKRYANGEYDQELESQIDKEWKSFRKKVKKGPNQKVVAFSISVVAAVLLFIGSAFVSPTVQQIAANIPYLKMLFESEPFIDEIRAALDREGYQYDGIGVSVNPREVTVQLIGSKEYYQEQKESVKALIEDVLKAKNYDAYKVSVMQPYEREEPTEEDIAQWEQYEKITEAVMAVLQEYGYSTMGQQNGVSEDVVEFELPNDETKVEEIKNAVHVRLVQEQLGDYTIKIHSYDPAKREREGRWMPVVRTISDGLTAKTEYNVKGIGYSNKSKETFKVLITTTLDQDGSKVEEVVENIETTIEEFLETEEVKNMILDDPYEIVIYSKDKEELKVIKN